MRESESKKRNLIIIGLCAVVAIMAVGFAAFSQQLQINSTSEVTSSWDIEITDIVGANPNGGDAYDVTPPSYSPTTASFSTGLITPNTFRVYQVEVSNLGTLTGQVSVASLNCGDNLAIQCSATALDGKLIDNDGSMKPEFDNILPFDNDTNDYSDLNFTLAPTEKNYIFVVVGYNDVVTQPASSTANISLTLTYVQAESSSGGSSGSGFTGTIYRNSSVQTGQRDFITTGEKRVWCMTGTKNGNSYNSCNSFYIPTKSDCEDNVADWVSGGIVQQGDLACHRVTISVTDGIGSYTTSLAEIQNDYDYYLKHTVVNDLITGTYVCFVSDTEHCLSGNPSAYLENQQIITGYQTYYASQNPTCYFDSYSSNCEGGGFYEIRSIKDSGHASVYKTGTDYCLIEDGNSYCHKREIDQTFVPQYYDDTYNLVSIGDVADISNWTTDSSEIYRQMSSRFYLGHDVSGGNVTANYVCFNIDDIQYCMKTSSDGSTYATNKALLGRLRDAGIISCSTFDNSQAECISDEDYRSIPIKAYSNGNVDVGSFSGCYAYYDGRSWCEMGAM